MSTKSNTVMGLTDRKVRIRKDDELEKKRLKFMEEKWAEDRAYWRKRDRPLCQCCGQRRDRTQFYRSQLRDVPIETGTSWCIWCFNDDRNYNNHGERIVPETREPTVEEHARSLVSILDSDKLDGFAFMSRHGKLLKKHKLNVHTMYNCRCIPIHRHMIPELFEDLEQVNVVYLELTKMKEERDTADREELWHAVKSFVCDALGNELCESLDKLCIYVHATSILLECCSCACNKDYIREETSKLLEVSSKFTGGEEPKEEMSWSQTAEDEAHEMDWSWIEQEYENLDSFKEKGCGLPMGLPTAK